MAAFKIFGYKKGRKYPIKRDEWGRSARQRCFEMFQDKVPFENIAEDLDIKMATVFRYHQQWAKNPDIERQLAYFKTILNKSALDRDRTIELLAQNLGISQEEVETILQQPSGLKRLLVGKIHMPAHAAAAHKSAVAFELALLISDHLLKNHGNFEDILSAFERLMKQNQADREEEDEEIKEENQNILMLRRIMNADLENERQGRVQPERLTDQEKEVITKWGLQKAERQMEIIYWLKIGATMAEGLTKEEAREKIYQDLVKKGDLQVAKTMRQFQEKVHPLQIDGQQTPSTPSSSSSS